MCHLWHLFYVILNLDHWPNLLPCSLDFLIQLLLRHLHSNIPRQPKINIQNFIISPKSSSTTITFSYSRKHISDNKRIILTKKCLYILLTSNVCNKYYLCFIPSLNHIWSFTDIHILLSMFEFLLECVIIYIMKNSLLEKLTMLYNHNVDMYSTGITNITVINVIHYFPCSLEWR